MTAADVAAASRRAGADRHAALTAAGYELIDGVWSDAEGYVVDSRTIRRVVATARPRHEQRRPRHTAGEIAASQECLAGVRRRTGWSTADVARVLGVRTRTVQFWQAGRHPIPHAARVALATLARAHTEEDPAVAGLEPRYDTGRVCDACAEQTGTDGCDLA